MNIREWDRSTIFALLSFVFGVTATIASLLNTPLAVIASVLTSLFALLAVFLSNYQKWLDTPPCNPFSDTRVLSRKEQEQLHRSTGGNVRLPNFFEWFVGRSKPIKVRKP